MTSLSTTATSGSFRRKPMRLGRQPLARARGGPLSPSQLTHAHWLAITLRIESSGQHWAWTMPIIHESPETRAPMETIVAKVGMPCCDLLMALGEQIHSKAFAPVCGLSLEYQSGAKIQDLDSHPSARLISFSFSIAGDDLHGEAHLIPPWIDAGLHRAFPHMPPMLGPFSDATFKSAEFTAFHGIIAPHPNGSVQFFEESKDFPSTFLQSIADLAKATFEALEISQAISSSHQAPLAPTPRL